MPDRQTWIQKVQKLKISSTIGSRIELKWNSNCKEAILVTSLLNIKFMTLLWMWVSDTIRFCSVVWVGRSGHLRYNSWRNLKSATFQITNQWAVSILGGSNPRLPSQGEMRGCYEMAPCLRNCLPNCHHGNPSFLDSMDPRIPSRNTATQLTKVQIFYFRILKSSQAIHLHALLWLSSLRALPRGFVRPLSTRPSCFIYLVDSCTPNLVQAQSWEDLLLLLLASSGTVSGSFCWWENHKATSQTATAMAQACSICERRWQRLCPGCSLPYTPSETKRVGCAQNERSHIGWGCVSGGVSTEASMAICEATRFRPFKHN